MRVVHRWPVEIDLGDWHQPQLFKYNQQMEYNGIRCAILSSQNIINEMQENTDCIGAGCCDIGEVHLASHHAAWFHAGLIADGS